MKKIFIISIFQLTLLFSIAQKEVRTVDLYVAFNADVDSPEAILSSHYCCWEKALPFDDETFSRMEKEAIRISGSANSIQNLRNIYKIIPNGLNDIELHSIAKALSSLSEVRYCDFMSIKPIKPPYDIPPATPDYLNEQKYAFANPGVNMIYAWEMNLTGQGIRVRDVEYGFNKNHEEFHHKPNVFLAPGMDLNSYVTEDYSEHGTATFGVVAGDDGGYGVSGLAHGIEEMVLYPEFTEQYGYDRFLAVSSALENSQEGDIIIYEMQTFGFESNEDDAKYVPAEYNYPIYDLTVACTDMGIIVVAAAGNGDQNLDSPEYAEYASRPNSGAIIVGAGSPTTQHHRASFSTHGSRVDLQGWGWNVLTSGYGDYSIIGNDFNQQYTMFSGTSSATPIVASCVAVIQSYYKSLTDSYLSSAEMIEILQTTGIPQSNALYPGNIGPLPNMKEAIIATQSQGLKDLGNDIKFNIYPNPFENQINIVGSDEINQVQVEIYSSMGQMVLSMQFVQQTAITIQALPSGIYFLKLNYGKNITVEKIIKK